MSKENYSTQELCDSIVEDIEKVKGSDITILDLTKIETRATSRFVICHAESNTQVQAIANSVEDQVKKDLKIKNVSKEGIENAMWILVNYGDIILHVFQQEYREFYNLEGLWADAKVIKR